MLGIDIGGNKILAIKLKKNSVIKKVKVQLQNPSRECILTNLGNILQTLGRDERVVGVCVPGIFDGGKIISSSKLGKKISSYLFPSFPAINRTDAMLAAIPIPVSYTHLTLPTN